MVKHRTAATVIFASLLASGSAPAWAEQECTPALPIIGSDTGLRFVADAFARLEWQARSSGGRILPYAASIWRGRIGARIAYLTFDEIPGTSGPNHYMTYALSRYPARLVWRSTGTRYDLGRWFVVRSGPLKGEWTVENCG